MEDWSSRILVLVLILSLVGVVIAFANGASVAARFFGGAALSAFAYICYAQSRRDRPK